MRSRGRRKSPAARTDLQGDALPERALARLGTVRWRMGGLFFACAYSPDGKTLAAASADHKVSLFDAATGKLIRQLRGHQSVVTSIAYSPDGTLASGAAKAGEVCIWEPATGKMLHRFHACRGPVWSLIFSRDGKSLHSGGHDSPILVWDPGTGTELRWFGGPVEGSRSLALSPDGSTVASNGNGKVQLWEAATGKLIRPVAAQKDPVRALAFSPDGKLLAAGSEDGTVWLLDPSTAEVRRLLPEDPKRIKIPRAVYALAFAPDGKTLAAGSADHTLSLWEVATGRRVRELPGVGSVTYTSFHEGGIPCVAFSPDGRRLAVGQDNRLAVLDAGSGEELLPSEGHRGAVRKVFFGPDGRHLLTVSDEPARRILQWDANAGRVMRPVSGTFSFPQQVTFSPDRKVMASVRGTALHLGDTETGKEIRRIPLPIRDDSRAPNEVVFSPDGKLLAVVDGLGRAAWLVDAGTGKQLWGEESTTDWAFALKRFSSDARVLAAVGNEAVQFVDVPAGRPLLQVSLPKDRVSFAADLSPDGRTLALASGEWIKDPALPVFVPPAPGLAVGQPGVLKVREIILWETATGKCRLTVPSSGGRVNSLLFSPDGRSLALGGDDQVVHLCDTATAEWVGRLEGHQGEAKALAFSPDGRRLASGSLDTTALVWDVSGMAGEKRRPASPAEKDLEASWSALAGADAGAAYQGSD
jgi:WD40 repeat protein